MLYERWHQIARSFPDELALMDLASGRRWTFAELERAGESVRDVRASRSLVFPCGDSADFVLDVLRGWRARNVLCPLETGQDTPPLRELPSSSIVHLKTTSATSGKARMVAFTEHQLAADVDQIVYTMGLRRDWPNLALISLAHSYGFSNLVLPLLLHGIPLVLVGSALPEALKKAARTGPTFTLPAVPALWQAWHAAGCIPENSRLCISAGAPLPLTLEQAVFGSVGLKIHNFYGSSECGGIAYDATAVPREENSCVGGPVANVRLSSGEDGALEVRSPAVGERYWPENSPRLANGAFQTGDVGELISGLVYLRGRVGDLINVAGRKLPPSVVERTLTLHPGVSECIVFGVPGLEPERGERIVACVALKQPVTCAQLRAYALERLASWQVPKDWWLVDTIDADRRGKVSRMLLRQRYLELRNGRPMSPQGV
jgi:acyl-CoA synthetase (AMP-forming)/AMP-acid ligase II